MITRSKLSLAAKRSPQNRKLNSRGERGRFLFFYGSDDIVRENLVSLLVHAASAVVVAGDNYGHVQIREGTYLVAAIAHHAEGGGFFLGGAESLEPPEVALVGVLVDLRMRLGRGLDPSGGYDALAVPNPAVQVELRQLEKIAAAQAQAAAGLSQSQWRIGPLLFVNPKRVKKIFLDEVFHWHVRGFGQRSAQREDAGSAIAEAASVGRVLGLGGPGRKAFDREVKRELDPIFDEIHALFITAREIIPVVALQQRTHGEEIFDGDLALARIGILQWLFFREEINDGRIELYEFLINSEANRHAGHGLAG